MTIKLNVDAILDSVMARSDGEAHTITQLCHEVTNLRKQVANIDPWANCHDEGYCIFCESDDLQAEGPIPRTVRHVHDRDCFWIDCCRASGTPYGDSNVVRQNGGS